MVMILNRLTENNSKYMKFPLFDFCRVSNNVPKYHAWIMNSMYSMYQQITLSFILCTYGLAKED